MERPLYHVLFCCMSLCNINLEHAEKPESTGRCRSIIESHTRAVETSGVPLLKRLDEEITEFREIASGKMEFEVWEGKWVKGRGKEGGRETTGAVGMEDERVTLRVMAKEADKKFERELLRRAELCHINVLPFYDMCRSRALPLKGLHGQIGIVTNPELRLCMVSVQPKRGNARSIQSNNVPATTHSDTYSFALLVLECVTEERPFSQFEREAAVIHARMTKRKCPSRPDGQDQRRRISDSVWKLMVGCWNPVPDRRPSMETVNSFLSNQG